METAPLDVYKRQLPVYTISLPIPARLTRRGVPALVWACVCAALPAAETPHGTAIEARLLTPISTYRAKKGMEIAALVATPVCADGVSVLPEGTELRGVVEQVDKVGLGLIHESAGLKLGFTRLNLPDGPEYTVEARVTGVDNARERVDRKGNIHGIRATATLSNRLGERSFFAALGHHPAAMIPLLLAE